MKPPNKKPPEEVPSSTFARDEQDQPNAPHPIAAPTQDDATQAPVPLSDNSRVRGRPATGKRSNPDWKLYSHFLRKNTQRAAVAKLQAEDDGRDLSDVLQKLLEDWLKA